MADSESSVHADAGQTGRQTTLTSLLRLQHPSWAARTHVKTLQSKAAGPLSGAEDVGVEQVTLQRYSAGRGDIEDGGVR